MARKKVVEEEVEADSEVDVVEAEGIESKENNENQENHEINEKFQINHIEPPPPSAVTGAERNNQRHKMSIQSIRSTHKQSNTLLESRSIKSIADSIPTTLYGVYISILSLL